MKNISIRFLKQGLVNIEIPDGTDIDTIIKLGKQKLDKMDDQDILTALSDAVPFGNNPTRFDKDSFQVEAVEDADNDYRLLFYTDLWHQYLQPAGICYKYKKTL